jgi:hypothetical protein
MSKLYVKNTGIVKIYLAALSLFNEKKEFNNKEWIERCEFMFPHLTQLEIYSAKRNFMSRFGANFKRDKNNNYEKNESSSIWDCIPKVWTTIESIRALDVSDSYPLPTYNGNELCHHPLLNTSHVDSTQEDSNKSTQVTNQTVALNKMVDIIQDISERVSKLEAQSPIKFTLLEIFKAMKESGIINDSNNL